MVVIRRAPVTPKTSSQDAVSPATLYSSKSKNQNLPERPSPLTNGKAGGDLHDESREDDSRALVSAIF